MSNDIIAVWASEAQRVMYNYLLPHDVDGLASEPFGTVNTEYAAVRSAIGPPKRAAIGE